MAQAPPQYTYSPPPAEIPYYDALFAAADQSSAGHLSGPSAVDFLSRSKLPVELLKQIWAMADQPQSNTLDSKKFHVAVRLIQLFQNGKKPVDLALNLAEGDDAGVRAPFFEGVDIRGAMAVSQQRQQQQPPDHKSQQHHQKPASQVHPSQVHPPQVHPSQVQSPQVQTQQQHLSPQHSPLRPAQPHVAMNGAPASTSTTLTVQDPYTMYPQELSRYEALFPTYAAQDPDGKMFVTGPTAVELFSKSGMDRESLKAIWTMVDDPIDNKLDSMEFSVAMHLIVCITKKGLPMPSGGLPGSLKATVNEARQKQQGGGAPEQPSPPHRTSQKPTPQQPAQGTEGGGKGQGMHGGMQQQQQPPPLLSLGGIPSPDKRSSMATGREMQQPQMNGGMQGMGHHNPQTQQIQHGVQQMGLQQARGGFSGTDVEGHTVDDAFAGLSNEPVENIEEYSTIGAMDGGQEGGMSTAGGRMSTGGGFGGMGAMGAMEGARPVSMQEITAPEPSLQPAAMAVQAQISMPPPPMQQEHQHLQGQNQQQQAEQRQAEQRQAEQLQAEQLQAKQLQAEQLQAEQRQVEQRQVEQRQVEQRQVQQRQVQQQQVQQQQVQQQQVQHQALPPRSPRGTSLRSSARSVLASEASSAELLWLREAHQKLQAETVALRAKAASVSEEEQEIQKEITHLAGEIGKLSLELSELKESVMESKVKLAESLGVLKIQMQKKELLEEQVAEVHSNHEALTSAIEAVTEVNELAIAKQAKAVAAAAASKEEVESVIPPSQPAVVEVGDLFSWDVPAPNPGPANQESNPMGSAITAWGLDASSVQEPVSETRGSSDDVSVVHSVHSKQGEGLPPTSGRDAVSAASGPAKPGGDEQDHFSIYTAGTSNPNPYGGFHGMGAMGGAPMGGGELFGGAMGGTPDPQQPLLTPIESNSALSSFDSHSVVPSVAAAPSPTRGSFASTASAPVAPPAPKSPTKAELEALKTETVKAEKGFEKSISLVRSISVEVNQLESAMKKAETEMKELEGKTKKGAFGGKKKKAKKEYEKAMEIAKQERNKVKEAMAQLATAEHEADKAKKEMEEYRQRYEQMELEAATAASYLSVQQSSSTVTTATTTQPGDSQSVSAQYLDPFAEMTAHPPVPAATSNNPYGMGLMGGASGSKGGDYANPFAI